ncbi:MAG: hypothetical protein LBR70_03880 [Lactobacillaceae bacterium]|jgi:electron transport complex protein RnfA|nr:hypothetical protein [Lactobacillaceae bacterium]
MKILLSAVFINNIVLISFLGLEGILANTNKSRNAFGAIVSAMLIILLSSIVNYLTYEKLLLPYNLEILTLILFSFNILVVSLVVSWLLKNTVSFLYKEVKEFIPAASVSSLMLGTALLNLKKSVDIYNYMYINFCNALGFALIIVLLTSIRSRLTTGKLPKNIGEATLVLLILGLISMAFMGFMGAAAYL